MKHVISHGLPFARSKELAEKAFADYRQRYAKYSPTLVWLDDKTAEVGFAAKGIHLKGRVELRPREVEVTMDVPFLLRMFKDRAIQIVEREVKKILTESPVREESAAG